MYNRERKPVDANQKLRVGIIGCGWIATLHMEATYINRM